MEAGNCRNIAEETCLVPAAASAGEEEREPNAPSFNFITDIFFLAHKCLDLGFRVVQEKFVKLNQELNRTQELYRDGHSKGALEVAFICVVASRGRQIYFTQPGIHSFWPVALQGGPR